MALIVRAVAALVVVALLPDGARASAEMHAQGSSGPIAYEALTGGVFTIRPDGTGNREIAPEAHNPVWSPDGSRLLYVGSDGSLRTALADGTDARLVIRPEDVQDRFPDGVFGFTDPAWSPSGRRIAFIATSEDEHGEVNVIGTIRSDGRGLRVLRRGLDPEWVSGGQIAFTVAARRSSEGFSNRIATMRSNGRGVRMLVGDSKGYRSDLRLSPDGSKLAFVESANQIGYAPGYLRVLNLATSRIRAVPIGRTGPVDTFTWTPGGTRLAYLGTSLPVGGRADPSSIYTIRPTGTGMKRLLTLPYDEQRGLWAAALSWRRPPTGP